MKHNCPSRDDQGRASGRSLVEFLAKNGRQGLPMVDLIVRSRIASDDLVDAVGPTTIEAVLRLSSKQVVGPPQ